MKTAANNRDVKTYQLANTILLLGCKKYSEIIDDMGSKRVLTSKQVRELRIPTNRDSQLAELEKIVNGVIGRKSFDTDKD